MIGIFDSGIGGLSVWQGIVQELPHVSTIYVADQGWAPYGNRPVSQIQARGYAITKFLQEQGASVVVVACNTATVNVTVNHLRQLFPNILFVGVEPPIKKLAELTKTKSIGLFATKATCESKRLTELVSLYVQDIKVKIIPTIEWATLVEANFPEPKTTNAIKKYLNQLPKDVDFVGLGCTHYPFLLPWLKKLSQTINWIDVTYPVAKRTASLYSGGQLKSPKHTFFTTGQPIILQKALKDLLSINTPVEFISI